MCSIKDGYGCKCMLSCPTLFQESSPSRLSAPSPVSSHSIQQLKQQLATLTSSMATLMEEKSKMEVNFQTDKKAILVCYNPVALGTGCNEMWWIACIHVYMVLNICVESWYNFIYCVCSTRLFLQAQQDALNRQHQVEKETAKAEISELHQRLEEVLWTSI